jgi:hypothetical protein
MTPIYYKRLMFFSHFNAGVRAVDIRDPYHPSEVAYYIPATSDQSLAQTSNSPVGSDTVRVLWARQNEQAQARNGLLYGIFESRGRVWSFPMTAARMLHPHCPQR